MRRLALIAVPLGLYAAGCRESSAQTAAQSSQQQTTSSKTQQGRDSSGRFVSHVEHIQPGGVPIPRGMVLRNPYEGNAGVAATGAKLFIAYNCMDCHGADGAGDGAEPGRRTLALRRYRARGVRVDLPGPSRGNARMGLTPLVRSDLDARHLRAIAREGKERDDRELRRRDGGAYRALGGDAGMRG